MQTYKRGAYLHQITTGMDVAGREHLLLVVKLTYDFPNASGAPLRPSAEQVPLVMADVATGEPGFSATLWETDFAFRKPFCDVILQGAAYAPENRPAERVKVGLKVGTWRKMFEVVGHREWRVLGPAITSTRPAPFRRMPFGYDTAFGGTDRLDPDDKLPSAYLRNPVGRGFASVKNQSRLSGKALPNTEEIGIEVRSPYEDYEPMAFGPVGRGWPQRLRYAGTYDQAWQDNIFPFLPADFDERYYQAVGRDQQITPPATGTEVAMRNLTPSGTEAFRLPETGLPVAIFRRFEKVVDTTLRPDTLLFDTEARVLSMVWRVSVPIRRILTEFTEIWIGPPSRGLLRAKATGKRYLAPGLGMALQTEEA